MKLQNPSVEIFSQGEEIVSGQTVDTNAAWLSQELIQLGFDVTRHNTVGDRMEALVLLLQEIAERAEFCICTGGLGPTTDDLTAEAAALAFNRPLKKDREAVAQIEKYFAQMGRRMPQLNIKQAMFPQDAQRLDNQWGTAPGFVLDVGRCWFAFVPGVPYEMKNLFREGIKPFLTRKYQLKPMRKLTLRCVGLGESGIQERLNTLQFPKDTILSFRTAALENQVKLLFASDYPELELRRFTRSVADAIGKPVFAIEGLGEGTGDLVHTIGRSLRKLDYSVAVIETLSGGSVAARCARQEWFKESLVMGDVLSLFERFGFAQPVLDDPNSMNRGVLELATLMGERANVDIALAQLWSCDHTALEDKSLPVRLHTGLSTPQAGFQYDCSVGGTAARKQTLSASIALDMLRRYLQGHL